VAAPDDVARFLRKIGVKPVIFHERVSGDANRRSPFSCEALSTEGLATVRPTTVTK
jgi:hypothetical protein